MALAEYFGLKNDVWLSDYFYDQCLENSLLIRTDGRRKEAEANFNLGISAEKKQNFIEAMHFMEISYGLSKQKDWDDSSGATLHHKSSDGLQRLYTAMAKKVSLKQT